MAKKTLLASPMASFMLTRLVSEEAWKEARKKLAPGKYAVRMNVLVEGTFEIKPPEEANYPSKVCPWQLCQLLASKLNPETVNSVLSEVARATVNGEKPNTDGIKDAIAAKFEHLADLTKIHRNGKTYFEGDVAADLDFDTLATYPVEKKEPALVV